MFPKVVADRGIDTFIENVARTGLVIDGCDIFERFHKVHLRTAQESCVPVECSSISWNLFHLLLGRLKISLEDN